VASILARTGREHSRHQLLKSTHVPIYVESHIRGPLEEVWRLTQTLELHERWDLRFSSITYLPKDDESAPQRFRYATRVGLGQEVVAWGETAGERLDEAAPRVGRQRTAHS